MSYVRAAVVFGSGVGVSPMRVLILSSLVRDGADWSCFETPVSMSMYGVIMWGADDDNVFVCSSDFEKSAAFRSDGTESGTFELKLPDDII